MMSWHKNILNLKASEVKQGLKVNCFAVTTSYFQDELIEKCLTAEEMLNWLVENTEQIANPEINDVFVIWSTSKMEDSPDKIDIIELSKKLTGYPFGLVMEHSGVFINKETVFQKASPKEQDVFETSKYESVVNLYKSQFSWTRVTFHRYKYAD